MEDESEVMERVGLLGDIVNHLHPLKRVEVEVVPAALRQQIIHTHAGPNTH